MSADIDPPWLKSPPQDDKNGRRSSTGGEGGDGGRRGRTSMGISTGRGRKSSGGGYHSEDEISEKGYDEDCCCFPLDPVLLTLTFFHGMCICLGLAGVTVNIHHLTKSDEQGQYQDIIMRAYTIAFSSAMVLCELDWRFFMRRVRLLDMWVFRGLFYIYVGLQTIDTLGGVLTLDSLSSPDNMVGFPMIIIGLVYLLMGACCLKAVAEARRKRGRAGYREIEDRPESNIESV